MSGPAARLARLVTAHPRSVLAALAALTLLAVALLVETAPLGLRLRIDPSSELLLPVGDPAMAVYRDAVRDFGDDEVYVIAMHTDDLFRAEQLAALQRIGDRLSRLPGVLRVTSLARVTAFRFDARGGVEVGPFFDRVPETRAGLEALRARALADPVYRSTLVSADGRTASLNLRFREMTDGEFIDRDLDGAVREVLRQESAPDRRFHVSGRPHVKSRMYRLVVADLLRLVPLALSVAAVVLALVSGSLRGVVLPLATVAVSVLWTFGAIAVLERPLTLLTVLLAPTLVAVGSVYGVHVVGRYEEEARAGGTPAEVVGRCVEHLALPVGVAGLTTMAGFGALLWTDVPAIFDVGAFSVLGVAAITLVSLTGIPAALRLLPLPELRDGRPRRRLAVSERLDAALGRALDATAALTRRRAGAVIGAWLVVAGLALAALPRISIDTDYLSNFAPGSPVRRDFDAVNRLLAGTVPLFVVVEGSGPGALRAPEALHGLAGLQRRVEALPGVSRTLSLVDTVRALNRAIEGDDPAAERIPDSRGAISEVLFLVPKSDLSRFATVDHSRANLVVRTGEVGSAAIRELAARIEAILDDGVLPDDLRGRITGTALLLSRAADGVARSQPRAVGLAALASFVLLWAALGSARLGLVAMIPNAVPVLCFFGLLGLGVAPLSLPTSLIGSVALGIAIDATAHFLTGYRQEREAGADPEEAARRCTLRVGRPIAATALMLSLGFLCVCFSHFSTLREFGALSAATMLVCCLTDLLLLPALLVRFRL